MKAPRIVIVNTGLVTSVGLSTAESAASTRARVARLREIDWRDRRFEPFIVGSVPTGGLPELNPLLAAAPLQAREARMLQLAHVAIEEALASLPIAQRPVPMLMGLPEHHTTQPIDPGAFLERLARQLPGYIDLVSSGAAPRGRAAGLMAIGRAITLLTSRISRYVLVGGVDSLIDLHVLGTLDLEERIRNEVTSDGFSPGEGAAALLLALEETAAADGLAPLAHLAGCAQGFEPGHLYADEPYLGDGLAQTFAQLLATPTDAPIGSVYCSFNGERYWAREFGVARTRLSKAFDPQHEIEHPAECFGDLGSAHGAALAVLATHGVRNGYRRSPCLIYASSDRGDRAAAVIQKLS